MWGRGRSQGGRLQGAGSQGIRGGVFQVVAAPGGPASPGCIVVEHNAWVKPCGPLVAGRQGGGPEAGPIARPRQAGRWG
jgi:hypothetical protein